MGKAGFDLKQVLIAFLAKKSAYPTSALRIRLANTVISFAA